MKLSTVLFAISASTFVTGQRNNRPSASSSSPNTFSTLTSNAGQFVKGRPSTTADRETLVSPSAAKPSSADRDLFPSQRPKRLTQESALRNSISTAEDGSSPLFRGRSSTSLSSEPSPAPLAIKPASRDDDDDDDGDDEGEGEDEDEDKDEDEDEDQGEDQDEDEQGSDGSKGGRVPKGGRGPLGGEGPKGGEGSKGGDTEKASCDVWGKVSSSLSTMFMGCNDDARASIRAVFHDCFPSGGCDGSLALPDELRRPINAALVSTVTKLKNLAGENKVSVADMLMFAGSHAVASCPGGPIVQTFVGRKDAKKAAPDGQLPPASVKGDEALQKFKAKGFSASDLAALIGAHSTARQFTTAPKVAGVSLDVSPQVWDTSYYAETVSGRAPFTLPSDASLANQTEVGPIMKKFASSKSSWDSSFAPALAKMQRLGTKPGLLDCTSALPRSFFSRDAKSAPINGRMY